MLAFRLIARLDIRNEHVIKTVRLEGVRKVGDPAILSRRYDEMGVDEILYLDVVASLYGRNSLYDLLDAATRDCFLPITAGGGVSDIDGALRLLRAGADKIAVNTAAVERPELITELAERIGSQSVVLQLDAKRRNGGWEAYTHGGRNPSGKDAIAWAGDAVEKGAGEILVTSIDREGLGNGGDMGLCQLVSTAVQVPVLYAAGIRTAAHVVEIAQAGASGVAMAGALHYGRMTLQDARAALKAAGVPCR